MEFIGQHIINWILRIDSVYYVGVIQLTLERIRIVMIGTLMKMDISVEIVIGS